MNKKWVYIILSLLMSIVIILSIFGLLLLIPESEQKDIPLANVEIIEAPTSTPFLLPTFLPTTIAENNPVNGNSNGIYVGGYAQISGTSGDGLSIRSAPGISNTIHFIGLDSELFKIVDGPVENEGYTWWKVEAPYDGTRTGWCVQDYLSVVNSPQE